jgi:hypothetical protein
VVSAPVEQRRMVGTVAELQREAAALRRTGHVEAVFPPQRLWDGRYEVTVLMRRRTARMRRRPAVIAATVATVLLTLAGTGYLVFLRTAGLFGIAARLAAGLTMLAAVWFALGRVGACPGLHCPGCHCGGHR